MTMRFVILLLYIVALSAAKPSLDEWNKFKTMYGKQYKKRSEEKYRRSVFNKNLKFIKKHNEDHDKGLATYTLKMNSFGDMTNKEINTAMTGHLPRKERQCTHNFHAYNKREKLPKSVDWVKKGAVTAVKHQQTCGSCWAFAAIGAIEGQQYLASKKLVNLSEQQLVDCSKDFHNFGCGGGNAYYAFQYLKKNQKVNLQKDYPYENKDGECRFNSDSSANGAKVTNFTEIPKGDENTMMHAVAKVGPIAVAINSHGIKSKFYGDGVYYNEKCPNETTHEVLVVGYGTLNGVKYWLVKNSWGEEWGDDGYIKMARDKHNHCGIANDATYPHVEVS